MQIDLLGNGGILKTVLSEGQHGDMKPNEGDIVRVLYSGRLLDSTDPFDSSLDRTNPFSFTLGKGQVIKGWDEVVKTMRKGEKCLVELKPEYAYGDTGSPPTIPGGATLVFEIELLSWKSENSLTDDNEVLFSVTEKNTEEWRTAKETWEVVLSVRQEGEMEEKEISVVVGKPGDDEMDGIWQKVATKLKRGERGVLTVSEGYLSANQTSTLTYDVVMKSMHEVEDLLSQFNPNKLWKKILKDGEGYERPKFARKVNVKVTGDAQVEGEIILGEGKVPEAVEIALENMKKGEHALITSSPEYGWPCSAETLTNQSFSVELVDFDQGKNRWSMEGAEKLEEATKIKEFGNRYFQLNKLTMASKLYKEAVEYFEHDDDKYKELRESIDALRLSCRLNLAATHLKQGDYKRVVEECGKALQLKSDSLKALYRRSQANLHLQNYEEAKADCLKMLQVDSESKEARFLMQKVDQKLKEIDQKQRKIFKGLFEKLSFDHQQQVDVGEAVKDEEER